MSDVAKLLNQLLRTAIEDPALSAKLPLRIETVELTPDGGRLAGDLAHPQARGRLALDFEVTERGAGNYAVELSPRELPAQLGEALEPFRGVLARAQAELRSRFDNGEGER